MDNNTITILAIIAGPIIAVGFSYFLSSREKNFEKIDKNFEKVEKNFDKVDKKFEKIDKKFEKVWETINELLQRVSNIEGKLGGSSKESLAKANSPKSLTTKGEELLKKVKGKEYLEEHFDELYSRFDGVTENYDIEKKAREVMDEDLKLIEDEIKANLYETGESIYSATFVMGLELRDMVMAKRKEENKKTE